MDDIKNQENKWLKKHNNKICCKTVIGLQAEGDDYITKPFSLAKLIARVEAHLRREGKARHGSMKMSGELFVDYAGGPSLMPKTAKKFQMP